MIVKARRAGTVVRTGETAADVRAFHELFVASRRRLGLPAIPESFFLAIWRHLPRPQRSLLLATRDGRPVAAAVSLVFGGIFILEYAGEAPDAVGSGAGQLVYWEAVRAACDAGCRIFSFGRTSLDNPTLATYKRHWATTEEDLLTFRPDAPRVQRRQVAGSTAARRLVGWLMRRAPRVAYDGLSGFCFRHWG
jgi:CelD/BcsL family acetyltransferase involved in cellulose biosynthesis